MSRSKREPKFQDLFRLEAKCREIEDDVQRIMEGVHRSSRWRPSRYESKSQLRQGGAGRGKHAPMGRTGRREANSLETMNPHSSLSVTVGLSGAPTMRVPAENAGVLFSGHKRRHFEVSPSTMSPVCKASKLSRNEDLNREITDFPGGTELRVARTIILPDAPQPGQVRILATTKQSPHAIEKDGHNTDSHWLFQI